MPSLALLNLTPLRERLEEPSLRVLDAGTGGGFPGLPLAIACPHIEFTLADGRGKKIRVVDECAKAARAANVLAVHGRVPESVPTRAFDFVLGRAVTALPKFIPSVAPALRVGFGRTRSALENGVLYLKGGDFDDEIRALGVDPRGDFSLTELLCSESVDTIAGEKRVLFFAAADLAPFSGHT